jgi:acyl carrier protein
MSSPYVAPRTDEERRLAEIWAEVLQVERVGILDDFFDLGGDSLMMTQVLRRMQDELGIDLTIRAIFDAPTVQALAERIDTVRWAAERALAHSGAAREPAEAEGVI